MAYFNDSVVRPFSFPADYEDDADYTAAAKSGNVIAFFLGWLIDNHNSQVQDFQKMKLGNVTVTAPDNFITRSNEDYASTWETLKAGLFESALGGFLCIRYEADGNYIDYLSEFTETNEQEIVLGENLLDLKNETEATDVYSAIIPVGALGLTLEGLADGNVTDDIVKAGDTLYSKKAVEEYGWIYAPISETTWDDVINDTELRAKGVERLTGGTAVKNAIEASAVDLHFTDKQVESLRIYKNVNVYSAPHGLAETFPLKKLEIDLLKPENTKITVGKTFQTLTDQNANIQEEAKKRYTKLSKNDEQIKLEVQDEINQLSSAVDLSLNKIRLDVKSEIDGLSASIDLSIQEIELAVQGVDDKYTALALTVDGVTVTDSEGVTKIKGSSIETDTLFVNAANINGKLVAAELNGDVVNITNASGDIYGKMSLTGTKGLYILSGVASGFLLGGTDANPVVQCLGTFYAENVVADNIQAYLDAFETRISRLERLFG